MTEYNFSHLMRMKSVDIDELVKKGNEKNGQIKFNFTRTVMKLPGNMCLSGSTCWLLISETASFVRRFPFLKQNFT